MGLTGHLADEIEELLVKNDPLEPWLTESHYDERYWSKEASEIARRLRSGMELAAVNAVVSRVLGRALPGLLHNDYAEARIARVAKALTEILAEEPSDEGK